MKFFRYLSSWILLSLILPASAVQIGDSRAEVEAELGKPLGQFVRGGRVELVYDGGGITLKDGRVVEVEDGWQRREQARIKERAFVKEQQAKGLVLHEGRWMKPAQRERLIKEAKAEADRKAYTASRKKPGARGGPVDLKRLLVPGKVTIVDFYADWCGPCRVIGPKLEALANASGDVVLRKVDIVKWGSPVARQFGLRSIPSVRVYDRKGNLVGAPTSQISDVSRNVNAAR